MEKMDAAEKAMAEEDYPLARQLAEEAQVDAQLAATTARSAKAQKAASALQEDNRVQPRGYGEGFPVAGNDNAASRQLNRRVELVFSDENGNLSLR